MSNALMRDIQPPSQYLDRAAQTALEVFRCYPAHALDEQAGPAYLKGLPLSRWIFWQRLTKAINLIPEHGVSCLDFGCGFGIMIPLLQRRFETVYGVDLMPELAPQFLKLWELRFGETCHAVKIESDIQSHALPMHSLDLILALDVLEHVESLTVLLEEMSQLLKPEGVLIVSGPTENWIYKLGRWIVGFSGDYHERSIHNIREEMNYFFDVELVDRVFYPFTLFHILRGRPGELA